MTSPARHAAGPRARAASDRPRPAIATVAGFLIAGTVVHVPAVWAQLAGPDRPGRRCWFQRAAAGFGQWPFTILCGFAALLLVGSVLASARQRAAGA